MTKLTRAERLELTQLRTVPLPLSPADCDRYCHLAYRDEQAFSAEMQRVFWWQDRQPALRTLADVLFWLCAVPYWVLSPSQAGGCWGR